MNNANTIVNDGASSSTEFNKVVHQHSSRVDESVWSELGDESILQELFDEPFDFEDSLAAPVATKLRQDENYKGFDNNSGRHWIYPINFPIRQYQFNITKTSLYKNTLVVLPTGLGKTFIAAVVMYNIFRWYPMGKIIFMAPTRPLVSQQIEACRKIMGISLSDMAEMTGKQNKKKRVDLWRAKRIFFATPQVVQSDVSDVEQNFPFDAIKLIVIDEAHKAKGRYAYVEVVQSIQARNQNFRILALTATPGRRLEDVGEVIRNLFISKLEVRWENCIDVASYTHKRNIKVIKVALGEELAEAREELISIIDPYIRNLMDHGFLTSNSNLNNLSKGWILMEQKRFREISMHHRHPNHSKIATDFSICISLYHSLELLERHGLRVFINFFDNSDPENKDEKFFVRTNYQLKLFLDKIRNNLGPNPFAVTDQTMTNGQIACIPDNIDFGHPKFDMVKKILIEHFQENKDSRVIIFCEFRESVMLMHRLLLQCRPLVKPRMFVGQGGGTGTMRAIVTQKQQLQIMNDFRQNVCNALIATCVAEEGLDIGEVDLIICFDISTKNPTRLVQRMGRTGRKREGKIIMMVTEGKEQNLVKETLANRDKINQKLSKSREIINCLYKYSPRLVPPQFNPICLEIFMKEESENIETECIKTKHSSKTTIKKVDKKPSKKRKDEILPNKNSDLRNFFKKIELDAEESQIFCTPMTTQQRDRQIKIIKADIICVDDCADDAFNENNQRTKTNLLNNEKILVSNQTKFTKVVPAEKDLQQILNSYSNFPNKSSELKPSTSTSSLSCSNDTDLKIKLRKFNSLTRKINKPKNGNIHDFTNILKTLKSKAIDNKIKKFLLIQNIDFVHKNFESMKVLWALRSQEQEIEIIDKSEKQIRSIYNLIESVLGRKENIEAFIQNYNKPSSHLLKVFMAQRVNSQVNKDTSEKDSIDEWIDSKLQNYNINDMDSINNSKEGTTNNHQSIKDPEDSFEMSVDFVTDSKYAHQFDEKFAIKAQSTPLVLKNTHIKKISKKFFDSSPITRKKGNERILETIVECKNVKQLITPIREQEMLKIIHEQQKKLLESDKKNKAAYKRLEFGKMESTSNDNENFTEIRNTFPTIKANSPKKFEWFENNVHNLNRTDFSNAKQNFLNNLDKLEYENTLFGNQTFEDLSASEFNAPPNKCVSAIVSEPLRDKLKLSLTGDIKKNIEISTDLFDDDFDEYVASSENILQSIETKSNHKENQLIVTRLNNEPPSLKNELPSRCPKLSSLAKPDSMKIDDFFSDSDFEFLSQSVEKLNNSIRNSNILDKSLDVIPVNDILDLAEEADDKRILKQKQTEHITFKTLNNMKETPNEMSNSQKENTHPSILNNEESYNPEASDIQIIPTNVTSANYVPTSNNFKSPSCTEIRNKNEEISPSLIGKRRLNLFKLKPDAAKLSTKIYVENEEQISQANDTIMPGARRKALKRLIDTDSEDESNIHDDSLEDSTFNSQIIQGTPWKAFSRRDQRNKRRKRRKHCPFIDDEATHSGNDSDDGANESSAINSMFVDSIVVSDNEEDDPGVNMQAHYLQSIRTPKRQANGFKIPAPRVYMDLSKICSQPVVQESFSVYKENSFVVSDEENVFDGENDELDELDKAEAILKAKRRAKRLQKQNNTNLPGNRKRILSNIFEISDDDD